MEEMLLLLREDGDASHVLNTLHGRGGRVLQRYGRNVIVIEGDERVKSTLADTSDIIGVYTSEVPEGQMPTNDFSGSLGISAWNLRQSENYARTKANRPGQGLSWGDPAFEREG
ncbi:MAG TPA: hypothetical protein VF707_04130 [Ardenticatenaceae bacterium]|jgi:hypothetical protein